MYWDERGGQHAEAFLQKTKCVAVIAEPLFLTNPQEAGLLQGMENIQRMAEGIYLGVRAYFNYFERINNKPRKKQWI